jgi:hypothetical protein
VDHDSQTFVQSALQNSLHQRFSQDESISQQNRIPYSAINVRVQYLLYPVSVLAPSHQTMFVNAWESTVTPVKHGHLQRMVSKSIHQQLT